MRAFFGAAMGSRARIKQIIAVAGVLAGALGASPARADHQPVIVVPGKPGVPVVIDGVEASGAIVSGDWGLYRPGHGYRVIDGGGCCFGPNGHYAYFPMTGRKPAYGRREIEAKHRHPRPTTLFEKSWSAGSAPGPVTEYPPFAPPPVVVAPRFR
jgi:hypothetical protein